MDKIKRKKYYTTAGIIVIIICLAAIGAMICKNKANDRLRDARNRAYVVYTLISADASLCTDRQALSEITPEYLEKNYGVDLSENSFIDVNINTENDSEYYMDYFCYYDKASGTAFVYDDDTGDFKITGDNLHKSVINTNN